MRALNLLINNKDELRTCEADVFMPNFLSERKNIIFLRSACEFYVHGSVPRESMLIIVQQEATMYSFIIFLQKQLCILRMIPSSIIRSTRKL